MKILHILDEYRIHPYSVINYLKSNFPDMEHSFFITKSHDYAMKSNPYLLAFPDLIYALPINYNKKSSRVKAAKHLEKYLKETDAIIYHTLRSINTIEYLKLATKPVYLNKSAWSVMGRDSIVSIHRLGITAKKRKERKKQKYLKKLENCRAIGLKNPSERESVQGFFPDVPIFDTPIMDCSYQLSAVSEEEYTTTRKDDVPIIWVGYNGYKFNAHTDLIDCISSSSQQRNFLTIFPMNYALSTEYGNKPSSDYVLRIKKYAEQNLKGQIMVLNRRRIPEAAYFKTLNVADSMIIPGAPAEFYEPLFDMIWLGKRIFTYSEAPIRQYLLDNGFCVHTLEEFAETEITADKAEIEQNRSAILALRKKNKEKWQEFFDFFSKEVGK